MVAPDKFKGSLSALEAATALKKGLLRVPADLDVDLCPVADGGEGTLNAAVSAGFRRVPMEVEGPTGQPVWAAYAERNGTAVVEMAEASGLRRLTDNQRAPLTASSFGAGQLVAAAMAAGNRSVILAVGGSASSDGGAGLVEALGARLLDSAGEALPRGGASLTELDRLDLDQVRRLIAGTTFVLASDVDNPLLGPLGAAAVYGPQKGASPDDVELLERALSRWASVVAEAIGLDVAENPAAGAAGGVGFAAVALLGASVVRGADLVLDLVRFEERLSHTTLVITGEGQLDEQTLFGKAPARVAAMARVAGVPVVAVVGRSLVPEARLRTIGIRRVYSLESLEPDISVSTALAAPLLERTGEEIAAAELGLRS